MDPIIYKIDGTKIFQLKTTKGLLVKVCITKKCFLISTGLKFHSGETIRFEMMGVNWLSFFTYAQGIM